MYLKRGQIWFADCPKPELKPGESTVIQYGPRPVIIYTNEKGANEGDFVTVVKGTTQLKKIAFPTQTEIEGYGLKNKTIFMGEQLGPIDKNKLLFYIGQLDEKAMNKVDKAVAIHLGIFEPFNIEYVKLLINEVNYIDIRYPKGMPEEEADTRLRMLLELETYCKDYGYNYKMFLNKYLVKKGDGLCG